MTTRREIYSHMFPRVSGYNKRGSGIMEGDIVEVKMYMNVMYVLVANTLF